MAREGFLVDAAAPFDRRMSAPGLWRSQVSRAWRRTVWESPPHASPPSALLRRHLRAWDTAVRSFGPDRITLRANALTFRTLLSLAPSLAVAFSVFKAFGGLAGAERALQRRILQNLAPGAAADVMEYVDTFLGRIASGAVSGVGVLVLAFTVVTLLTAVERSFNALWQVARTRVLFDRVVVYWAMVTVGPVLFGLSFALTSAARTSGAMTGLAARVPAAGAAAWTFLQLAPWLITCAAMTALYIIVPNTAVRWRAALGGGVVAGTLWELAKGAFTWASSNLFRYDAIYGSFAALFVLLLWIQLAWVLVLLGAKVSYALQHERALAAGRGARRITGAEREALALRCTLEVARAFLDGRRGPTAEDLSAGTRELAVKKEVLNPLVTAGLLVEIREDEASGRARARDAADQERYLPGRDPRRTTLKDIIDVIRGTPPDSAAAPGGADPLEDYVLDVAVRCDEALGAATASLTVAEAVGAVDERVAASGQPVRSDEGPGERRRPPRARSS
jgi:membrane protein